MTAGADVNPPRGRPLWPWTGSRAEWRTRKAEQQPADDVEAIGQALRTLLDGGL